MADLPPEQPLTSLGVRRKVLIGLRAIVYFFLVPLVLFLAAGTWNWPMAWIYLAFTMLASIVSRLLLNRFHPDLITERATSLDKQDFKAWDRTLVPLIGIYGPVAVLIVAGLDHRFGWPGDVPAALVAASALVLVLGYLLAIWALLVNRFFSAVVRIQTERGHTVITDGPYRSVRHPGYAAGILTNLAVPLLLCSTWALLPALLTAALTVLRTVLEDRTLQEELPGYREYAARVRYRLFPGIW